MNGECWGIGMCVAAWIADRGLDPEAVAFALFFGTLMTVFIRAAQRAAK